MKIRMLIAAQGASVPNEVGEVCDVPDSEAVRLISARYAVPHTEAEVERAVKAAAPEKRRKKPG